MIIFLVVENRIITGSKRVKLANEIMICIITIPGYDNESTPIHDVLFLSLEGG
jgi:hypothetical protein